MISIKKAKSLPSKSKWKLFWCWTPDHHEDWFVVAKNAKQAKTFFLEYEGYDHGDYVKAEFVTDVPENYKSARLGWPDDELLDACGGEMRISNNGKGSREVTLKGNTFFEGSLQSKIDQIHEEMNKSLSPAEFRPQRLWFLYMYCGLATQEIENLTGWDSVAILSGIERYGLDETNTPMFKDTEFLLNQQTNLMIGWGEIASDSPDPIAELQTFLAHCLYSRVD